MAKKLSLNRLKTLINLRLNWIQGVRKDSSPVHGFTIDFGEIVRLLPNKLAKQIEQINDWTIKEMKMSAETSSANQLKTEVNATLSLLHEVGNEAGPLEGNAFNLQENFFTSEHFSKTIKLTQQLKKQKYKKVGQKTFLEPTENGN